MKKSLKNQVMAFALAAGLVAPSALAATPPDHPAVQAGQAVKEPVKGAFFSAASPYQELKVLEDGEIVHLKTGVKVTEEQLINSVAGSRVIYIGELHDNMAAHEVQLDVIRRLQEKFPGKIAVGMEMFRRSSQEKIDQWQAGELLEEDFKSLFEAEWGMKYEIYQPIFDYLKEQGIPVVGLKSSKALEAAFKNGAFYFGDTNFSDMAFQDIHHRNHIMEIFTGFHGGEITPIIEKMYKVMVVWDEVMAQTVAEFLDNPDHQDKKLVVIAGGGHLEHGFGIPKRAFRRSPHDYSVILPTVRFLTDEQLSDLPLSLADFAWTVPYDCFDPVTCGRPQAIQKITKKEPGPQPQ